METLNHNAVTKLPTEENLRGTTVFVVNRYICCTIVKYTMQELFPLIHILFGNKMNHQENVGMSSMMTDYLTHHSIFKMSMVKTVHHKTPGPIDLFV